MVCTLQPALHTQFVSLPGFRSLRQISMQKVQFRYVRDVPGSSITVICHMTVWRIGLEVTAASARVSCVGPL